MAKSGAASLRKLWLNVHLWIGIGLGLLIVPIAISGALLVWHDHIDALVNPARYAVSGTKVELPPSAYLASAARALPANAAPVAVRYPESDGWPLVVSAAGRVNVYLDPPTARVLEVVNFRSSFIGVLHRFHENLTIPEYSGRAVVGWVGVGMLISSLTGIYLWWPRNSPFTRGLRWRRSPETTTNLHHLLGFWISIPLAVVSATGIYLGFPQQGRELLSSMMAMSPRPSGAPLARQTMLTPDSALEKARASEPGAQPAVLFLATQLQGGASPLWRVQLRKTNSDETATVLIDDQSGKVTPVAPALTGDRTAQWIRWIHEGSRGGPVWQTIVFLCGAFPPVFAVTGLIMWLRRRPAHKGAAQLRPAE